MRLSPHQGVRLDHRAVLVGGYRKRNSLRWFKIIESGSEKLEIMFLRLRDFYQKLEKELRLSHYGNMRTLDTTLRDAGNLKICLMVLVFSTIPNPFRC